uniref:glutathione transferase n=1 Tax=Heterorhabditis bacteriophora TaxID=37862 RepID=A0A1I7XNZ4_HETBA
MDYDGGLVYVILHGHPHPVLYNCSSKSEDEWYETGVKRPFLGLYFIISGIILELLYIPCLMVIMQNDMIKNSCYKIMVMLGILDIWCLFVNSVVTGYLAFVGAVYCTHPLFIYITGGLGCTTICSFNAIAAYIYVYMQFFHSPNWLIVLGQIAWQYSHEAMTKHEQKHSYTLYYFDSRGRAEPIRLIFHYFNVHFNDQRLTKEEWVNMKPDSPMGQLPYLSVDDGKIILCQMTAICRYLAKSLKPEEC